MAAALFANGAIAVLKSGGFVLTGSPSMLSETYHSISDTGNQVFLLVGIRDSEKRSSREHPFGYGKAQFFYSFLVAVLLFGIAGWESARHGYSAIAHGAHGASGSLTVAGATVPSWYVNVAVLLSAIGFETYALAKATGNEILDAIAALLIGLLLMGFALALACQNKRLLLGESLPKDVEADERVRYVFAEPEV